MQKKTVVMMVMVMLAMVTVLAGCPPCPPVVQTDPTPEVRPSIDFRPAMAYSGNDVGDELTLQLALGTADPHNLQLDDLIPSGDMIFFVGIRLPDGSWQESEILQGKATIQTGFSSDLTWACDYVYWVSKEGRISKANLGSVDAPLFDTWWGANNRLIVDNGAGGTMLSFTKDSYWSGSPEQEASEGEGEGEATQYATLVVSVIGEGMVSVNGGDYTEDIAMPLVIGSKAKIFVVPAGGWVFSTITGYVPNGNSPNFNFTMPDGGPDGVVEMNIIFTQLTEGEGEGEGEGQTGEGEGEGEELQTYRVIVNPPYYAEISLSVNGQELEYSGSWATRNYPIQEGATVVASARLSKGHTFAQWISGYTPIITNRTGNPVTFIMPNFNFSLTAE